MARPVDLRCELAACIAVAGSVVAAVGRWRPWLEGQRYPRKRRSYQARGRTPGDPPQVAAAAAAAAKFLNLRNGSDILWLFEYGADEKDQNKNVKLCLSV